MGACFGSYLHETLQELEDDSEWKTQRALALRFLGPVRNVFPSLIAELEGYARGAGVSFDDLWALCLEEEFNYVDKCTTIVTNEGHLLAHNEDWDIDAKEGICVLRKSIGDMTILELYYLNTLGGNAISINSHGIIQAINSLPICDFQGGIPRNIVARWVSQSASLKDAVQTLHDYKRSSGYHHTLVDLIHGEILSIECSAKETHILHPDYPFVHTNHFHVTSLRQDEDDELWNSRMRHRFATTKVLPHMPGTSIRQLLGDRPTHERHDIFNERTIARMIVDMDAMKASVWLLREKEKGWIDYPLDFVSTPRGK